MFLQIIIVQKLMQNLLMDVQKPHKHYGIILELFVDNLEKAKQCLIDNGCEIIKWKGKGKGKDCFIIDPFGIVFNIWEQ